MNFKKNLFFFYSLYNRFFDQLGHVFKFIKDDAVDKLTILQTCVDKDNKVPTHYDTIQKAVAYETEKNLIKTNPENFTRTLLQLHRALIFIAQFLQGLNDRPALESTTVIAMNCYDATLYQYRKYQKTLMKIMLYFDNICLLTA